MVLVVKVCVRKTLHPRRSHCFAARSDLRGSQGIFGVSLNRVVWHDPKNVSARMNSACRRDRGLCEFEILYGTFFECSYHSRAQVPNNGLAGRTFRAATCGSVLAWVDCGVDLGKHVGPQTTNPSRVAVTTYKVLPSTVHT